MEKLIDINNIINNNYDYIYNKAYENYENEPVILSTLKLNDIKFIIDSSNIKKFKLVLDNIFEDITFINNNNNKIIYKKNKINN